MNVHRRQYALRCPLPGGERGPDAGDGEDKRGGGDHREGGQAGRFNLLGWDGRGRAPHLFPGGSGS